MRITYFASQKHQGTHTLIDKDLNEVCKKSVGWSSRDECGLADRVKRNLRSTMSGGFSNIPHHLLHGDNCDFNVGLDLAEDYLEEMGYFRWGIREHVGVTYLPDEYSDEKREDSIQFDFLAKNVNGIEYCYELRIPIDELLPFIKPALAKRTLEELTSLAKDEPNEEID